MPLKLTNEVMDERLKSRNIKRIGDYTNSKTRIEFQCVDCCHIWSAIPNSISNGSGCPKCFGSIKLTNEDIDRRLEHRNIKRLDNYINNKTKIKWKCLIDNYIWEANPRDIFTGHGCSKCAGLEKLTNEIVDKKLIRRNIKRLDNYINSDTKIMWLCLVDNHSWEATPNSILNANQGCPICSGGKNERIIKQLILKYVVHNHFKHHKPLYFNDRRYIPDFYLEVATDKIIIEYNGIQHYKPIRFGGISRKRANENFIKQQKRDEELRQYCKENNIFLLEIPYTWEDDKIIEKLKSLA